MFEMLQQYPVVPALLVLAALALVCSALPGFATGKVNAEADPRLVDRIDQVLPQTQCGQCGYPGCRPYAQAIATGDAINKCPPGGQATIARLADMLGRAATRLDPDHGEESAVKKVAFIREQDCIGCTKCIQACPVDAIVGAAKQMHTVIAVECTGCDLCVEPCPVDCIDMVPVATALNDWGWSKPGAAASDHLIATDRDPRERAA